MFETSLDLSDVLARLQRADESLAEFVAPLWPGVRLAAAWIEGKPRLFRLPAVPDQEGFYLLAIDAETATVVRPADEDEVRKFLGYLGKADVILLDGGLAYPGGSVERLQGITAPRPIHFAEREPLSHIQARFDGLNLFFFGGRAARKNDNPFEDLLMAPSTEEVEDLFGLSGEEQADTGARTELDRLHAQADLYDEYRVRAVVETAGAIISEWSRAEDGLHVRWRLEDEVHDLVLPTAASPITSGISLAGARHFDPATLVQLLHAHILDGWRER